MFSSSPRRDLYATVRALVGVLVVLSIVALGIVTLSKRRMSAAVELPAKDCAYFVFDHQLHNVKGIAPLEPVLFAAGSAVVSPDGLDAIGKARNFLRANPDYALLLHAYTDTVASDATNRLLARHRGDEVRRLLLAPGGIQGNRVFVAELPKQDLPRLTQNDVNEPMNRSVAFFAARLSIGEETQE